MPKDIRPRPAQQPRYPRQPVPAGCLNPLLWTQLQQVFGTVKIQNPGAPMQVRPDIFAPLELDGKPRFNIIDYGETYLVNCPRPDCHDTRQRLAVNHRFGVQDERGHRNLFLVVCHHNGCYYRNYEAQSALFERLNLSRFGQVRVAPVSTVIQPAKPIELPGDLITLDKLPPHHPANAYLAGRFYDPEQLGREYGVGWCPHSMHYHANNRIIVPIFAGGKMVGWQGRYIGDIDFKEAKIPKWYFPSGSGVSRFLYNYDRAKTCPTGVIVEGIGDAWGFGTPAVATFGSHISERQQALIIAAWNNRSAILLYDPDCQKDRVKMKAINLRISALKKSIKQFAVVWLPEGYDPGSMDQEFMRWYVQIEAQKQGVSAIWSAA